MTQRNCDRTVRDMSQANKRITLPIDLAGYQKGAVTPSYHGGITAFLHSKYVQKLPNRNNLIQNSRQKRS